MITKISARMQFALNGSNKTCASSKGSIFISCVLRSTCGKLKGNDYSERMEDYLPMLFLRKSSLLIFLVRLFIQKLSTKKHTEILLSFLHSTKWALCIDFKNKNIMVRKNPGFIEKSNWQSFFYKFYKIKTQVFKYFFKFLIELNPMQNINLMC